MSGLSPWVSRLLAVTLLILVLAGLWSVVLEPVLARFANYDSQIEQSAALVARYERLARAHDSVVDELSALQDSLSEEDRFLTGQTEELAAVQVQQMVKGLSEESGATLQSVSIREPDTVEGFRKVALQVKVTSDIEGLQGLLHGIESSEPYLFVEDLSVRGGRIRLTAGQVQGADQLQVNFDVFGFYRGEAP